MNTEPEANTAEDQDLKRRRELLDRRYQDLSERQLSNTQSYDRTILTLSSALLGFSIAAVRFIAPIEAMTAACLMIVSWTLLGVVMVLSVTAFWVSNQAIDKQMDYAERYYERYEDEFFNKKSGWDTANDFLNLASGSAFVAAITLIIIFVSINLVP